MAQPRKPRPPRPVETKAQGNRRNKIGGASAAIGVAGGTYLAKTGATPGARKHGAILGGIAAAAGVAHGVQYYNRNKRNAKTGVRTSNPAPVRTQGRVKRK